MPFLARDDIRGGLAFSAGAWTDSFDHMPPPQDAVEQFLETVEGLLAGGVSCVAEYVVRSKRPQDLERLLAAGDCVVIMTRCDDPTQRVAQRNMEDRLLARPAVLATLGFRSLEAHTEAAVERMRRVGADMMTTFPVPALTVDTTAGYDPGLEAVIDFATAPR